MLFLAPKLDEAERQVIEKIEGLRTSLSHQIGAVPLRWTGMLRRNAFARAIQGSNSIEGYDVTVEDAIAAAEGEEPLDTNAATWSEIVGYRNAMTYVLQLADDPHFTFTSGLLRSFHFMMLHHHLTKHPGRWRPGAIFVRNDERGEIVYEGPDVDLVPPLMTELIHWLRKGDPKAPAIVRAAMAHLNLVMIHPYSDGNGRMARCLQTLVLAREGILAPQFCSIEEYLGRNTRAYYDVLGQVGGGSWHPDRDARPWLRFVLTAHYRQAETLLRRVRESERVWDTLDNQIIQRRGLPDRLICALYDAAFNLRVRNSTYRSAAEVSDNVASRDLTKLAELKLLVPKGEKRGRYYVASALIRGIRDKAREPKHVTDPFDPASGVLSSGQRPLFGQ
jgi:Fic family protein